MQKNFHEKVTKKNKLYESTADQLCFFCAFSSYNFKERNIISIIKL